LFCGWFGGANKIAEKNSFTNKTVDNSLFMRKLSTVLCTKGIGLWISGCPGVDFIEKTGRLVVDKYLSTTNLPVDNFI
jgi:hypothetical protein